MSEGWRVWILAILGILVGSSNSRVGMVVLGQYYYEGEREGEREVMSIGLHRIPSTYCT